MLRNFEPAKCLTPDGVTAESTHRERPNMSSLRNHRELTQGLQAKKSRVSSAAAQRLQFTQAVSKVEENKLARTTQKKTHCMQRWKIEFKKGDCTF